MKPSDTNISLPSDVAESDARETARKHALDRRFCRRVTHLFV